jgi:hypothetical protein
MTRTYHGTNIHPSGYMSNPSYEGHHDDISDHTSFYQGSTKLTTARTTFHSSDAPRFEREKKFDRFYQIQHGLQPNRWTSLADKRVLETDREYRIDSENHFKTQRLECISDIFSQPQRQKSINRVKNLSQSKINRFNTHHKRYIGAILSARLSIRAHKTGESEADSAEQWTLFTDIIKPYAEQAGISNPPRLIQLARSIWSDDWKGS